MRHPILLLVLLLAVADVRAQQDDLRRVLEQGSELRHQQQDQQRLQQAESQRPTITVDGQTVRVERTIDDLGQALYLSLQHQQWQAAAAFLSEYIELPGHDPLLRHYAQGALARVAGDHRGAAREYEALLEAQPDFLPARLELARVYAEDQRDREAAALFAAIAAGIDSDDPATAGVRARVDGYLAALQARQRWKGAVAAGPAWSDNINRSSASRTCLFGVGDNCIIERTLPKAQHAVGLDYDASLERRWALAGHHGLYVRGLAFGQAWRGHSAYNELNTSVQAGYSWRSARHTVLLAPSYDYQALGNHALQGGSGMHGEWQYALDARSLLKLEADWKRQRYRQPGLADNYDGELAALYATWFSALNPRWTVFAGVDLTDSHAADDANGYRQRGVRLGAARQWSGTTATVFVSLRQRDYDAWSSLLEARRQDDEQNLIAIVRSERLGVAGLVPSLSLRYARIDSNVGWLYSHDRSLFSLKWERAF
ncbi:surface lipoprotein assembly modifier [Stenotrophomonas sp. GD03937]|uniref:surface lipoprotein assembly modifier n=2 Tax=Gammaproteobacteria TaxID=1236 RepID=UPI00244B305A|nr:surface lipoprotein assembly modifier [Stenotrophomonas sp. GD03937]MDH1272202.1 surface lipoprotein assembly modifier [Stenotrophomonas sp. GD03937]